MFNQLKNIVENNQILRLGGSDSFLLNLILSFIDIRQRIRVIRQTKELTTIQTLLRLFQFIKFQRESLSIKINYNSLLSTFLTLSLIYKLYKSIQTSKCSKQQQTQETKNKILEKKDQNINGKLELHFDNKQDTNQQVKQNIQIKHEIQSYRQMDLLYQQSFKQRVIEDQNFRLHIRQIAQKEELYNYYNIDDPLFGVLKFIPVRGDGNCFFTSLGFQYILYGMNNFQILLDKVQKNQFNYSDEKNQAVILNNNILNRCFSEHLQQIYESRADNNLLKIIQDKINDQESSFYGLLIIFMRNLFYEVASDEQNEEAFLIQNRENVNKILEWEYMFDETEALLRLFSVKEQIIIKVISKLNIDDQKFRIQEYNNDNQNDEGKIIYGLTFQPGHYNAVIYKNQ